MGFLKTLPWKPTGPSPRLGVSRMLRHAQLFLGVCQIDQNVVIGSAATQAQVCLFGFCPDPNWHPVRPVWQWRGPSCSTRQVPKKFAHSIGKELILLESIHSSPNPRQPEAAVAVLNKKVHLEISPSLLLGESWGTCLLRKI